MKALISLILAVALFGGVYLVATGGCKAQAQVAGDKMMDKINGWLGELEVKEKKIENKIEELEAAMTKVNKKKIETEVRLEQLDKERAPVVAKISRIRAAINVLRPHVEATEPVEINGKPMSPAEIQDTANELANQYELLNQKLGGHDVSVKAFKEAYTLLNRQYETGTTTMKRLKTSVEQIKVKKESLDAMKTAQKIVGENGSISDEFTKLESEINDLFVEVETGIRVESEKISQREAMVESSASTAEEILGDIEKGSATASRLDAILGDENQ